MQRRPNPLSVLRVALVVFVLAWLFGPYELRSAVPIWLPFLIALGLELQFFVGGFRAAPVRRHDRGPQAVDRERYGYADDTDELLLVRDGDEELWLPYRGETHDEVEALIAEAREQPEEADEPAPDERRRRGPPFRRFLAGLGLIGALVLIIWVVEGRTGWDGLDRETRTAAEKRLSQEASGVAAKPVTIRCDDSGQRVGAVQHADGVAVVGGDIAYLTPERCFDLYRLAFQGEIKSSRTARALAVLAHEAWHLRGVRDEGTTECYALQSGVDVGRRLGLLADTARQMMRQQFTENALHRGGSLEYLVPRDCRDGGPLDLHPGSGQFP